MTHLTPQAFRARGACSREDPQPKLAPATTMSPGSTVEEKRAQGASLKEAYEAAADTAEKAAAATAGMRAAAGRAKWLGERAAEYPDGGAVLCSIIAKALVS